MNFCWFKIYNTSSNFIFFKFKLIFTSQLENAKPLISVIVQKIYEFCDFSAPSLYFWTLIKYDILYFFCKKCD